MSLHDAIERVILTEDEVQQRVRELGAEIAADYEGNSLLLVAVLRGASLFVADLARAIDGPVEIDFMAVSSYGSQTKSSGVVRIIKDLDEVIDGRHVLVVEDIIDTGLTLKYLLKSSPCSPSLASSACRSTASTPGSPSPTSSSSATAWTTPRSTATSRTSGC